MKLRAGTKDMVLRALDETYFTRVNFDVKFSEGKESTILDITFLPNKELRFHIEKGASGNLFHTDEAPGEYLTTGERFNLDGFKACMDRIKPWTKRILKDLRQTDPIANELDELRILLEQKIEEHISDEGKHFSDEEVEKLRAGMRELEVRFKELEKKHLITQASLEDITGQLNELNEDLRVFSKGTWYRTAAAKVTSMVTRLVSTKEGRDLIASSVKALLPGNGG